VREDLQQILQDNIRRIPFELTFLWHIASGSYVQLHFTLSLALKATLISDNVSRHDSIQFELEMNALHASTDAIHCLYVPRGPAESGLLRLADNVQSCRQWHQLAEVQDQVHLWLPSNGHAAVTCTIWPSSLHATIKACQRSQQGIMILTVQKSFVR